MPYLETSVVADSPAPDVQQEVVSGIGQLHQDFTPLKDKWGVTDGSRDDMLKMVWDYAVGQSSVKDDRDAILYEVTKLSNKLGSVGIGEKPWMKVYAYVSTVKNIRDKEKMLREMENG